jgi:LemA protein
MDRINFWGIILILAVISFFIFSAGGEDCDSCYSNDAMFFKFLIIGSMFVGATFIASHKWAHVNTLLYQIERQPIIDVASCTDEVPVQIVGEIIPKDGLLKSYSSKIDCVFFHYILERYHKSKDSGYWAVEQNICQLVPFKIKDASGEITVNLTNVDSDLSSFSIDKKNIFNKEAHFEVDYANSEVDCIKQIYQKSIGPGVRESEYVLVPNMKVFVNGWVHEIRGEEVIGEHEHTPLILSRKTKDQYLEDFAKGDNFFFTSNFILLIGGIIILFAFSLIGIFAIEYVLIVPVLVFSRIIYNSYNRMRELENRCSNALSQIDIELKKRIELIPILEEITKRYSRYEGAVTQLSTVIRSDAVKSNHDFEKKFFAVIEAYPDLKTNTLFKEFILNLKTIENNISYYRGFHNKTVTKYNTLIGLFPFIILSKIFNFKEKQLLEFK